MWNDGVPRLCESSRFDLWIKVKEGRPHVVDMIKNGEIVMIINTVDQNPTSIQDSYSIRRSALQGGIAYYTTIAGARAACTGLQKMRQLECYDLQGLNC